MLTVTLLETGAQLLPRLLAPSRYTFLGRTGSPDHYIITRAGTHSSRFVIQLQPYIFTVVFMNDEIEDCDI